MTDDAELRAAAEIVFQGISGHPVPPYMREEFEAALRESQQEVERWMNTPKADPELERIRQAMRKETP